MWLTASSATAMVWATEYVVSLLVLLAAELAVTSMGATTAMMTA